MQAAADLKERLASEKGRAFWRSLEEYAGTPAFSEMLGREFPQHASEWDEGRQPPALPRALRGVAVPRRPLGVLEPAARGDRPLRPAARRRSSRAVLSSSRPR